MFETENCLVYCFVLHVTYLHKISHMLSNINFIQNYISSKYFKICEFFISIKATLFGQNSFKIIVFYTFLLDFSSIFNYYQSYLNDVECGPFSLTSIFSLLQILALSFSLFSEIQNFGLKHETDF